MFIDWDTSAQEALPSVKWGIMHINCQINCFFNSCQTWYGTMAHAESLWLCYFQSLDHGNCN